MSFDLNNIKTLDIMPENLKDDIETQCFSAAFDVLLKSQIDKIKYIKFFSRVDSLNDLELLLLAKELHVDVYDENWTLEQKRVACKNSIKWHIYKGTPWMLEDYVQQIYGASTLEEWFDYKGLSYHFRILIDFINNPFDASVLEKIREAIHIYKNKRSKLDDLAVRTFAASGQRFVGITRTKVFVFTKYEE